MSKGDETKVAGSARGEPANSQSRLSGRCQSCGCDTREALTEGVFWTATDLVVFENIPVRLCDGCGEQFFEEGIVRRVQEALLCSGGEPTGLVQVSVYSMPAVRAVKMGRDHRSHDRAWAGHEKEQVVEAVQVNQGDYQALTCKYCGAETVENLTRSAFWADGKLIAVENIPARVCQHCKEQFYDDETAGKIAAIKEGGIVSGLTRREVLVPVFSCAHIRGSTARNHRDDAA